MKISRILLSGLLITSSFISSIGNHGIYYAELEALKQASSTKALFDEDAHQGLSEIQRDITIFKNLTSFQRFVRGAFLGLDVIVVTLETMPKLYEYIDDICQKTEIATPTVFLTRKDGFLNAFAQKLFMSTGGIVIGQKLLQDLSDDVIEAIVAHEIGHIKHNHINKRLVLLPVTISVMAGLFVAFIKKTNAIREVSNEIIIDGVSTIETITQVNIPKIYAGLYLSGFAASLIPALIINKRFEKEADEFACKENGKSRGIIEFFEFLLKKEQLREEEFVAIYELLQQNKLTLTFGDYCNLMWRYYVAKLGHNFTKAYKYVYHNTFLGAHPSPEARIAAAKEYLASQEA